jgi:Protein of unknown function (DUF1549)/Protein of unknown function (DUF1553)/Planctomycete cytochrome C
MNRMAAFLVMTCCATASAAESPADREFFERKVRPLLVERCHSCHSTAAKKQKGGLRLDSAAAVLKGGQSGPAVIVGEPEKSRLIEAVRYGNKELLMPPRGKLSEKDVAILEEWIRRGVPFPESGAASGERQLTGVSIAEGRKWWAFQPVRKVTPPAVRDASWPRRRIDPFILAQLEKHGLTPSRDADRRVLIRRAKFDLLGLPPTPEEVETFVNDPGADAYERLVERLLTSPLYGERWGRFWLDLARYADVTEPWSDVKAPAHVYRDWVVRAFNDDLPYDRFVRLQLAADLMPDVAPADRAALGFIGLSPTYWKELKLDKDVIRTVVAEEWEERIHTLGSTFLGLTVACARCHDHKFDPISQADYYALAGIFASTRLTNRSMLPDCLAAQVTQAHEGVKTLQGQIDKLQAKKPLPAEATKEIEGLKSQIAEVRRTTPHFDDLPAPGVDEASLYVLPDGPNKTKLEYKAGAALDVAMQLRGNPANTGPVVPRRFLAVLSSDPPKPFKQGSGRLELANAIVTDGGPLAARVIVNRVWKSHFGAGLVETPSDFGSQGARPSHPDLLDDLAARFVENGWSLKWLHREIMLSATYRQSSRTNAKLQAADADNRLLGRMNRRRLEVEAWRDAMLAVTGTLRLEIGGPARELGDPSNQRRTLYGTVTRRELSDLLRLHDVPDATTHSAGRVATTTPLQGLFVLNSPLMQAQSAALVRRLKVEAPGSIEERVRQAYLLLYGRPATERQVGLAMEFLKDGSDAVWEEYAQVLLGSNEFLFVD